MFLLRIPARCCYEGKHGTRLYGSWLHVWRVEPGQKGELTTGMPHRPETGAKRLPKSNESANRPGSARLSRRLLSSSFTSRRSIGSGVHRAEPPVAFPESVTETHDDENTPAKNLTSTIVAKYGAF
jgi:hypothetical protein